MNCLKRAELVETLMGELRNDIVQYKICKSNNRMITKTGILLDIRKIRRELLKLYKLLDQEYKTFY